MNQHIKEQKSWQSLTKHLHQYTATKSFSLSNLSSCLVVTSSMTAELVSFLAACAGQGASTTSRSTSTLGHHRTLGYMAGRELRAAGNLAPRTCYTDPPGVQTLDEHQVRPGKTLPLARRRQLNVGTPPARHTLLVPVDRRQKEADLTGQMRARFL